jgi:hypothetical protein
MRNIAMVRVFSSMRSVLHFDNRDYEDPVNCARMDPLINQK